MRDVTIKMFLIGLILFLCKASVLSQDIDISCEIGGLDFNLSQHDPGYLIDFGSFSLFAKGEEVEKKGGAMITKFYQLPRTKLILSVFVAYIPKDESLGNHVVTQQMILGKKRFPITSPQFDEEKMMKDTVNMAFAAYPMRAFDEEGKGNLYTAFLGKGQPVVIMMTCKKVKKAGK